MLTTKKISFAIAITFAISILWPFGISQALAVTAKDLSITVNETAIAPKFPAYVGGGANIEPPEGIGGGGGIPMISMGQGAAWLAGEVSSNDPKTKLIRITFMVTNYAPDATSFKIGDVRLSVGTEHWDDFIAVGYNTQLCAISGKDRKKVRDIVVELPSGGQRTLSYVFPISTSHARNGEVTIGTSHPVTFEIQD